MTRLSQTTQTLYAELLHQLAVTLPNLRGISFCTKTVSGNRYWYMEIVVGSTKRQFSVGRDTQELRDLIERQKALSEDAKPDIRQREKLVAMLISGDAWSPGAPDGRVLEMLSQAGVFLSGGVLIGSHAFNIYSNMLGIHWNTASTQTGDMDLASPHQIEVAMRRDAPDVKAVLMESGMSFFEVPALDRKSPSTSFKIRGQEFHVDLLTPEVSQTSGEPTFLPHFNTYAYPVRFLEFLLTDTQAAAVPFRSGILVNVPHPARFALHKLVVSKRRPAAQQTKANKDVQQSSELLKLLLEDRPGDVWLALDAAQAMPEKFRLQLKAGIESLPGDIRTSLGNSV